MIIYIDSEFKCHTENADGRRAFESDFFDGKCKTFVEGYIYVPEGETWVREDGESFNGIMIAPWKDYSILAMAQSAYEDGQINILTEVEGALGI